MAQFSNYFSCVLKTVEKMINARLQHFIEQNDIIPNTQCGFRKMKSCSLTLAQLTTNIHNAFIHNEHICGALLDVKSAFDDVCPILLQKILTKLNIPAKIRRFIFNLMTNRNLFFKIAGEIKGPFYRNRGVPQGCVLSPTLYNLYVIGLALLINEPIKLLQYADDTFIYCNGTDIQTCILNLEHTLETVNSFFKELKLTLSPEKTKFIIFTKQNYNNIKDIKLCFNNTYISPSKVIKYLGLYIDYNLSWTDHFNYIIGKSTKLCNILKIVRRTWWGGHPQVLLNIYKSLIRSTMEYNLYLTNPKNTSLLDKLQKIQNQAIRLALGYRKSTPINVMHAEAKI